MKDIPVDDLPPEFSNFLAHEYEEGCDESLNELRAIGLSFYNGELFGNEVKGRSQYRTRDVQTVIDYMVEAVLELFVSGDHAVEFEHDNREMAKQATALLSRDFMRGQDGYRLLHDWFKAGLIEKTSVIKTSVVAPEYKTETETIPADAFGEVEASGIELVSVEPVDDENFIVTYRRKVKGVRFVDTVVPNEELSVNRDARSLDSAVYVCHEMEKTLSELRAMGFDSEKVDTLQSGQYDQASLSRLRDGRAQTTQTYTRTGANAKVLLLEEHAVYDLDEDGFAERLITHRVEREVLSVQESPCMMFEEFCPFPMPHRRVGHSLADKSMDLQLLRSTLARQAIDNMFQSNVPRVLVNEDGLSDNTMSDVLDMRIGAPIRYRGDRPPAGFAVPFVAGEAFNAMQLFNDELESRTGVTKANQGLNRDVLNKTATGAAMQMTQGRQKEMFLARNFAEAFSRFMRKKYKLYREYGEPVEMMVDGELVMIDPSQWPEDIETSILVGMGTGRKEDRVANLLQLAGLQAQAIGAELPIVTPENVYKTGVAIVENMSLGKADDYWTAPGDQPDAQPKPDPEMAKVEAQKALDEAKLAGEQALADARLAGLQAEGMEKQKLAREQADHEATLARQKAEFEAGLAENRMLMEQDLAERRMAMEERLAERKASAAETAALSKNREGGRLDV